MKCIFSRDEQEDNIVWNVQCHYAQARIANCNFSLGDCASIKVKAIYFPGYPLDVDIAPFFFLCYHNKFSAWSIV